MSPSKLMIVALASPLLVNSAYALTAEEKAQAQARLAQITDDQFRSSFQCPEALGSQAEQVVALTNYFNWVSARHGDWSLQTTLDYRFQLLEEHHCTRTLENIRRNGRQSPPQP